MTKGNEEYDMLELAFVHSNGAKIQFFSKAAQAWFGLEEPRWIKGTLYRVKPTNEEVRKKAKRWQEEDKIQRWIFFGCGIVAACLSIWILADGRAAP